MTDDLWSTMDDYFATALHTPDPVLDAARADAEAAGLPDIAVAANQGKLLNLLVRATGARRILEIGTLGGYSTIWLARALPPWGKLVTCEYEQKHADVARANLERAGFTGNLVDIRVGAALDTLPTLEGPFDFVFIDADKVNSPGYLKATLDLSRPGTMIVIDNVVRYGKVLDPAPDDQESIGIRQMVELMRDEPRLDSTAIQTVGAKGHDGFILALVQ